MNRVLGKTKRAEWPDTSTPDLPLPDHREFKFKCSELLRHLEMAEIPAFGPSPMSW